MRSFHLGETQTGGGRLSTHLKLCYTELVPSFSRFLAQLLFFLLLFIIFIGDVVVVVVDYFSLCFFFCLILCCEPSLVAGESEIMVVGGYSHHRH